MMTDNLLPKSVCFSLSPVRRISIAQWKLGDAKISYSSLMGRILALKYVYILIPGTSPYTVKGTLDVMKLRTLR